MGEIPIWWMVVKGVSQCLDVLGLALDVIPCGGGFGPWRRRYWRCSLFLDGLLGRFFLAPGPAGWVSDSRRILVVPDRSALQGLCGSTSFRNSFDLGIAPWRRGYRAAVLL